MVSHPPAMLPPYCSLYAQGQEMCQIVRHGVSVQRARSRRGRRPRRRQSRRVARRNCHQSYLAPWIASGSACGLPVAEELVTAAAGARLTAIAGRLEAMAAAAGGDGVRIVDGEAGA